ncbi:MAG: hypothetical protein JW757_13065 [Anaerolineales bacterium]|nr:hypothetical protein [Anaerolineales bacterium]
MNPIKPRLASTSLRQTLILAATSVLLAILSGCSLPGGSGNNLPAPDIIEKAQVIFSANIQNPLFGGEQIEFVVVDEVTGLPYHQERIPMFYMDDGSYGAVYEAPIGTVITYYFQKVIAAGGIAREVQANGDPVWCRRFLVSQPGLVKETIAGWEDELPNGTDFGEISGVIVSDDLGEPLKDILVSAGGAQTLTDANGAFTLFPIAPGNHNLSAISMTGTYLPAQNNVLASPGKITPAEMTMQPTIWKQVTFRVNVPDDTIKGAPIRLAGNLAQLGNTFHDLGGGISTDTRQMPVLTFEENGWYSLEYLLPAGIDIRYKYTLGDGFWNAEHGMDQSFVTHQLILPFDSNTPAIEDRVFSWRSSNTETIWFRADLPQETPQDETIGIQFSIAEWLPALPMFKVDEDSWAFPLISPHNFSDEIPFRFCRETPCTGVGQAGIEINQTERQIPTYFTETHLATQPVTGWTFLSPEVDTAIKLDSLPPAGSAVSRGIAISPISAHPSLGLAQANHVILSPAWIPNPTGHPRMFTPSLERTVRWDQLSGMARAAHDQDKIVSLYPQMIFSHGAAEWWKYQPTSDEYFWLDFLTEYREFIFQYAQQAALAGIDSLILGGEWLLPALPVSDNYTTYSQPGNIEGIWTKTINEAREIFPGEIGFVLTLQMAEQPPAFISLADTLYLQWDLPLEENLTLEEMKVQLGDFLDELARPLTEDLDRPLIILLAIPSLQGYHQECIPSPNDEGDCVDTSNLKLGPALENPAAEDLQMQAEYYSAFLAAVSKREWISGVISQGYYPDLALHDTSASIHGKPAEKIFESWVMMNSSGN